jgi:hypothetical protein
LLPRSNGSMPIVAPPPVSPVPAPATEPAAPADDKDHGVARSLFEHFTIRRRFSLF